MFRLSALITTVVAVAVIVSTSGCSDSKVGSLRIAVSKRRSLESLLSVHGEAQTVLTINGREFAGVRGGPPYYLPIPELKAIIFVTTGSRPEYAQAYHIVKTESGEVIDIPVLGTSFGDAFGQEIGQYGRRDKVERVDGNVLVLSRESKNSASHHRTYYFLDLSRRRLVREVQYFLGHKGETNGVHETPLEQR